MVGPRLARASWPVVLFATSGVVGWTAPFTSSRELAAFGSHKLAGGTTTVRALAFSCGRKASRLDATYADGDLVAYVMDSGKTTATVESANTLMLALSRDGGTIAGADSSGSLALFESGTLRLLYRVRFASRLLPSGLVFTHDCRRLIEMTGTRCRVWEPAALLQGDHGDGRLRSEVYPHCPCRDRLTSGQSPISPLLPVARAPVLFSWEPRTAWQKYTTSQER